MKTLFVRQLVLTAFVVIFQNFPVIASNQIVYSLEELGPDRWKAVYTVENTSLINPIQEFAIWFDYGLYSNLSIETPSPLNTAWNETIYDPYVLPPLTPFNGYYDALGLDDGIAAGQLATGFAITFDWLGVGLPAVQRYEVLNPQTFETLAEGQTVYIPEPATGLLLILSCAYLRNKSK